MKERNTGVKLLLLPFLEKLLRARVDTGIRAHQFVPEFVCEVSLIRECLHGLYLIEDNKV
jgi:hypothetical protein